MAQLRVHQLAAVRKTTTALQDVYTVPAGHRAILRSISAISNAGASQRVWVSLHGNPYIWEYSLGAAGTSLGGVQQTLWVVLEPLQVLSLELGSAAQCDIILSGTEHFI